MTISLLRLHGRLDYFKSFLKESQNLENFRSFLKESHNFSLLCASLTLKCLYNCIYSGLVKREFPYILSIPQIFFLLLIYQQSTSQISSTCLKLYMYYHHFGGGDIVNHGGLVDVTDIMLQCRWSNAMACNILSYPINRGKGATRYCHHHHSLDGRRYDHHYHEHHP